MTEDELALLREWIQEPISEEWNDDRLNAMYVIMEGNLRATAGAFWRGKAASVAMMGDITENGSSRKMSDAYKNALALAGEFEAVPGEDLVARPRTRAIVRP